MKLSRYKKDSPFSYCLGAFPSMELLSSRPEACLSLHIHSTFSNQEYLDKALDICSRHQIPVYRDDDRNVARLNEKENVYVVATFKKYEDSLDKEGDHLLLDKPSNMGNLGTIIRSSLGFGVKDIALISPCPDYFDPKVVRSSMGALFKVRISKFASYKEYKEGFPDHIVHAFMLDGKNILQEYSFPKGKRTLAFGNEATGLPPEYLDENSIYIRHSHDIDSLNITNAVSIGLYELKRK